MYKIPMTYEDFDGNKRTEDFYFHLSKADILEMETSVTGGLERFLRKIVAEQDNKEIVKMFKELVFLSYGEKSPDGKRFVKSKELTDAFSQTNAYSDLFMKIATDAGFASEFVNGIIPAGLLPKE